MKEIKKTQLLQDFLRERGLEEKFDEEIRGALSQKQIDAITFQSPSGAFRFINSKYGTEFWWKVDEEYQEVEDEFYKDIEP